MEAVTAIMLGTTRENAAEHLNLGATDAAWDALGSGEVGVVVAPEGSSMPSGIDTAPISRDALVFFVGADSPVSDLSSDELRSIFTGRRGQLAVLWRRRLYTDTHPPRGQRLNRRA